MLSLAWISILLGILAAGGGILAIAAPDQTQRKMENYSRSVWPGRILLAVDMTWAAIAVNQMHLGGFDAWKVHLMWLVPVLVVVGAIYLDELLSVRALGGLLLLVAGPILAAARWHPSAWRLVISVLAYLWIIVGLFFVLEPWWFHRIVLRFKSPGMLRAAGIVKLAFGFALVFLGVLVY